jgi:predicted acetyltransferase|tara:strand:+ start:83 stop:349 length:267 start_codon:yes stop_codon:yes gene_type:complete
MKKFDSLDFKIIETEGVFTMKNINTTIGFVRFNEEGEIEYIFVNPIFRKKGLAKKMLKLVKDKTNKKIVFQEPISPLGSKLMKSIDKI